jgi:hypothetical protein
MQTTIRITMLGRKPLGLALVSVVGGLLVTALAAPAHGADRATQSGAKSAISAPAAAPPRNGAIPPAPGAPPANDAPKVKVERGSGGHKVYRITEEIRIEGKIQKPEAFFFYQKSSINYDWQELKQDFIPKILDSVSKAPF